jgi:DNA replication and repair protein RecF
VRLQRLVARGYRNLVDLECEPPPSGAAILGANAQGKTNLLEAIYYPVLFRSFRGSPDAQVMREGPGFHVETQVTGSAARTLAVTYAGRRKQVTVDGADVVRLADVAGVWLAVAFLPADLGLASGAAAERRRYLDRLLSLASRTYLSALTQYRAALAQRNSALRQGRTDMVHAFGRALFDPGAELVRQRLAWVASASEQFAGEFDCLGERGAARLRYRGRPELAEPGGWQETFHAALTDDRARGMTTIGPHRDDLVLEIGGRPIRDYGSTGQQRSAAVALKLIEIATLRSARATEPALLLDDVFAELDQERQTRLARRLIGPERQVFVTSPRPDELPRNLELPVWLVEDGKIKTPDTSHLSPAPARMRLTTDD